MRIARFTTRAVRVPRDPASGPAGGSSGFVTLTVTDDDGIGYAGFVPAMITPGLKAVLDGLCEQR